MQDLASFSRGVSASVSQLTDVDKHDENAPIYSANIVILGDTGVGKTSIAKVLNGSRSEIQTKMANTLIMC